MLLEAAAVWRIFIYPSARLLRGSARRAPLLPPPACLVLHMPGTGIPNMCITSREHQSYCVAELLHLPGSVSTLPWPAQSSSLHHLILKPKLGWLKSWAWLLPLPHIPWEGSCGHSALGSTTLRGCTEPSSWTFHPFSWTFSPLPLLYVEKKKLLHWKRKKKWGSDLRDILISI